MNPTYERHVAERAALGIPPLPLHADAVRELTHLLLHPPAGREGDLLSLLMDRIPPGVDPAAKVKVEFLTAIARGEKKSPLLDARKAVALLGTMLGGYNVPPLIEFLDDVDLAPIAASALQELLFVFDSLEELAKKMHRGNRFARAVFESWARMEWFSRRPPLPEALTLKIFKVEGEVNTDDLSPARHASTRSDIPLHALSMGENRFPGGIATIASFRREGYRVAFAADIVGTGSSRKSATNSLLWHIGEDIPCVPNKRRGGVVLGNQIAPIFFNTLEDAGALPIRCDVSKLKTGDVVTIRPYDGVILDREEKILARFELHPPTLADEFRAGGRIPLLLGRKLAEQARESLGLPREEIEKGKREQEATRRETVVRVSETAFCEVSPSQKLDTEVQKKPGYTLAQKIVGRACGVAGVFPGTSCEPRVSTVGSQDTTGPMTRDELLELACLRFAAPMVMQSFCHTAAYPNEKDKTLHATLPRFITERGGLALRPGDGIIHSWLNRLLLPDTVGTGADSHTRFPLGISFPAGSGLVAFAAAFGIMPLDMPESVLVTLSGTRRAGITLRDVVHAIPFVAMKKGFLSPVGEGDLNIFNSRILELEGTEDVTVEEAFELTCASAERSAAAATIVLSEEKVADFLRSNVVVMKRLLAEGYTEAKALRRRIEEVEAWLSRPSLLARDANARYAAEIEIDLASIEEPLLACPNNPDRIAPLSSHAGRPIDEVFLGSCMTHIAHFRAAARIFDAPGAKLAVKRLWIAPPTRLEHEQLAREGVLYAMERLGARIEIPGCSLCMGNQARVADGAVVFSTSTRNFDHRMGKDAQVYLGSAELAAVVACLGRIPTPEEYFSWLERWVTPYREKIDRPLRLEA